MRVAVLAAICSVLVVRSHATTVALGGNPTANEGRVSSVTGATTVNFDSLSPGGPQSLTAGIANYSNLNIRQAVTADIVGDSSPFADPTSVIGDMVVTFSQPIDYFGLYWGSPDPTNTITFYNGVTEVFTYTGSELAAQFSVPLGDGYADYVNFNASPGEQYTEIVISADGESPFENDNEAFTVATTPEINTALLTASGMGIAILNSKRRSRR